MMQAPGERGMMREREHEYNLRVRELEAGFCHGIAGVFGTAVVAILALLFLSSCATGSLDCADLRQGDCKVSFQRFLTDTSATFTGPEGLGFTYSSSPNAAATQEAFAAINRLAGLLAAARPPVPLARPEQDDAADGHLEDDAWQRLPAPRQGVPWMIEGVASAVDL